jgi:hypothetical protein
VGLVKRRSSIETGSALGNSSWNSCVTFIAFATDYCSSEDNSDIFLYQIYSLEIEKAFWRLLVRIPRKDKKILNNRIRENNVFATLF